LEVFGEQALPFDPSRPAQPWFDSTAEGEGSRTYSGFDPREGEGLQDFTIPAAYARTPNLSGEYDYPGYEPVSTPAIIKFMTGGEQALSPVLLSTQRQAEEILLELRAAGLSGDQYIEEMEMPSSTILWNGEDRRIRVLVLGPKSNINIGKLIRRKASGGAGHPGHWVIGEENAIGWVLDEPDDGTGAWDLPVPLRPLAEGERIARVGFGVVVTRVPESDETGGGIPADLRQKIEQTYEIITRVFG
jgi:hypothetical protein